MFVGSYVESKIAVESKIPIIERYWIMHVFSFRCQILLFPAVSVMFNEQIVSHASGQSDGTGGQPPDYKSAQKRIYVVSN
jgi:hypothetical protein